MNDPEENPLHFENEVRKLKIQAETEAKFFTDSEKLSPKQESHFLDYIEAFNKAAERKAFKKVKETLGNPIFPDPTSLDQSSLTLHLEKAYQLLHENNISLDVLYDVPDSEIYRFIVEDLMEYEMAVIDVPDAVTCFTYEEFYPNDEEDLKRYTEEFIGLLAKKSFEFMGFVLHSTCLLGNMEFSSKEYISIIKDKLTNIGRLEFQKLHVESIEINEGKAVMKYHLKYEKILVDGSSSTHEEEARFEFTYDMGYWYLQRVTIPSLYF